MATVTQDQINDLTALYVGYFDRAPDPAGLQFWIEQIDNGREFNTIAADFAASPEALDLYPYLSTPGVSTPASFITSIYMNMFNRSPDAEGLAFWTDALADGSVSAADMIEAIINGARDDADATPPSFDQSVLDNKIEVGLHFAQETANVPGFEFDAAAAASAAAVLDGVDETDASVAAGMAQTDAFIAGDSITSNPGDTILLTPQIDNLVGTDGDDTFIANDYSDIPGTNNWFADASLQGQDIIDGAGGNNKMIIEQDGLKSGANPTISNIQTITNAHLGGYGSDGAPGDAHLDLGRVSGLEQLWSDFDGAEGNNKVVYYTNASADTVFGVKNVADTDTLGKAHVSVRGLDEDDTLQVALDGNAEGSYYAVLAEDVKNISIDSADGNSGAIIFNDYVENVTVTGAGDLEFLLEDSNSDETVFLKSVVEFDASASSGDITVNLSKAGDLESAAFGAGADDVSAAISDEADTTFDLGAGNDVFTLNGNGDTENSLTTVTLGAGKDTFALEGRLSNIADADEDEFESGMIVITDFNASDDVLDLSGMDGNTVFHTFSNTQSGDIGDADSLFKALDLAAGVLDVEGAKAGIFDYDGDAYLFRDSGNGNRGEFGDGDGLVQLVGMSASDFGAESLVVA